jgi:propanol-preferring alcohol dehydrogenase
MERVATMTAMELGAVGATLRPTTPPVPLPGPGELLIEVAACGVCRTDLHIVDGDIAAHLPIVPGHEIVGRVIAIGEGVTGWQLGARAGVPWLARTCGTCRYCRSGRENLCDAPRFTGFDRDGGFASHATADARFCLEIPDGYADVDAAPLLCAGLIGYRAYRKCGAARVIGIYGFGAAAHIIAQVAVAEGRTVHAFTRPGDLPAQAFARSLGCAWVGATGEPGPAPLEAAIIFASVGPLVPEALRRTVKGGRVVCAGIHMTDIPAFPYADLWGEREIVSVANLTRADGHAFMALAARLPIRTHCHAYPLASANEALADVRAGRLTGAAVLVPERAA